MTQFVAICLAIAMSSASSFAEESTSEKSEATATKAMDSMSEAGRNLDDKICETVNGKVNCVSKKIKNKLKNASEKSKSKVKELRNKAD
jgi:hypothetical protein